MKLFKGAFIAAAVVVLAGCATMMGDAAPEEERSAEYVYEFPEQDADTIFLSASTWFVETFVSSESVIELRDPSARRIAGKYTYTYWEGVYNYIVKSTIIVDARDGRARMIIRDPQFGAIADMLSGSYAGSPSYRPLVSQAGIDVAQAEWAGLAESFRQYVEKPSAAEF